VALVSTVKSVIKPLYLLAAPYSFTVMKWLTLMLSVLGSLLFRSWLGNVLCVIWFIMVLLCLSRQCWVGILEHIIATTCTSFLRGCSNCNG